MTMPAYTKSRLRAEELLNLRNSVTWTVNHGSRRPGSAHHFSQHDTLEEARAMAAKLHIKPGGALPLLYGVTAGGLRTTFVPADYPQAYPGEAPGANPGNK